MTIYAQPIAGGTLEGDLNNAHIVYALVASGSVIRAGMALSWTATDKTVEIVDSSDAVTAMLTFAGISITDYPSVKYDQYYDDGFRRGYTIIDTDSENYMSATDVGWADIDQQIGVITQGRVHAWIASGASGTAINGAYVVPAHGLVATKFDGMLMVYDDSTLGSASGAFRPCGKIVSGTTDDIAGSTYGTTTGKAIAKVEIDLRG